MSQTALFITHRTQPGQRDAVHAVWEKHMRPNIAANPGHQAYFYCFDDNDLDTIAVFQVYRDAAASRAFLGGPWYAAYLAEVTPLLAGEPELRAATPMWAKA